MTRTVLETRGLTKKYGAHIALDSVSLTLKEGEIYGLVGRNGAGKTTFFKCVTGLAAPTSGTVEFGQNANPNAARRNIGIMIGPSFFPYLDPYESLDYLRALKGIRDAGETGRLLKIVGLDGVKKPFKTFSLGMKQRLGVAAALLGSPPVVILDEPTNGLDPQGVIDMREVLKNAREKSGSTLIVSSHILSELDLVATRFGFLERGVLIKEIGREELRERTKKTLIVETDGEVSAALVVLNELGADVASVDGNRLTLRSHLDRPAHVARALVERGVAVSGLYRRETTLEEYFIRLIGGAAE